MRRHDGTRVVALISGLVLATTALAGCGSSADSGGQDGATSEEAAMELGGSSWNLASYAGSDGATVPAVESDGIASLAFSTDGSWSGSTGCNRIAGAYTQDGASLTIEPGPMTLVACQGPVLEQEQAIVAALPLVTSFASDGSLELRSAEGVSLLTYAPGLAGLAGTSWQATGINNGKEAVVSQAGVENATLTFGADGEVSGSGGCNSFTGTYTVTEPDGLTFGPLASTAMACEDDVMQIEQDFFTGLANVTTYEVEADRLTLRDASGATQATLQQTS